MRTTKMSAIRRALFLGGVLMILFSERTRGAAEATGRILIYPVATFSSARTFLEQKSDGAVYIMRSVSSGFNNVALKEQLVPWIGAAVLMLLAYLLLVMFSLLLDCVLVHFYYPKEVDSRTPRPVSPLNDECFVPGLPAAKLQKIDKVEPDEIERYWKDTWGESVPRC